MDEEPTQKKIRLPKKAERVKNKASAELQITAEQLVYEAKERELETAPPPPKVNFNDPDEVAEYQRKKRKEFEDNIRKNQNQIANWVKYGKWEESVGEIQRARSVFERALDVDHRNITLWLQYAEMEMRNKQINRARNVWDRAVTILPRATQFWLKYSYMEELIENVPGARQVFERWMAWEPYEQAWRTYINFELRYNEIDRARDIYQRFLHVHYNDYKNWINYSKFEERFDYIANARAVYEHAVDFFDIENLNENLLVAFGQFEERQKEYDRARMIYKFGLDNLRHELSLELYKNLTLLDKRFGEHVQLEDVIITRRKQMYEKVIAEDPFKYDNWFDYIKLLMNENVPKEELEDIFERAICHVPPQLGKRYWRRYVWLWIYYAVYEETVHKDFGKCREIYRAALNIIPHKEFTFAKLWIMFAHFELRQMDPVAARKIMGNALGRCRLKKKLYRSYIEMEINLREFDRCRKLYQKFLSVFERNSEIWRDFALLEYQLGEIDRSRAILELGVKQTGLYVPELLWKAFIDFEIGQGQVERVRQLYEVLLENTNHIKVWISWTAYEIGINEIEQAREVFKKANKALEESTPDVRLLLLETWQDFEIEHGNEETQATIKKLMPEKLTKRKRITTLDGDDAGFEEYTEYVFPDGKESKMKNNLLELAKRHRQALAQQMLANISVEERNENTEQSEPLDTE